MLHDTKRYDEYSVCPALETPHQPQFSLDGVIGERASACVDGWLLHVPEANPALTEMFRDPDRLPNRDLVPWAGEFAGKHLISCMGVWRLTGDDEILGSVEQVILRLLDAQADDGYLGPFPNAVRLREKWDVWGHYHIMLGLLDYADACPGQLADRCVKACLKIAELMHAFFVSGNRRMLTADDADGEKNHAIAHALIRLHRRTGDQKSLKLVKWIEDQWEIPPAGQYMTSALSGMPVWDFPAHRWESVHDWQAIAELYLTTGDQRYRTAFEHIWWSVLEGDRHNTGGFTSGEACQGNPYDRGAIETCCTMAWIAMSIDMLRITGDSRVADEIELSTFNGMLGGQHPSGRWWTYNTPMDGEKKASAHDIVFQARAGSPELNCCSVNAPRGIGMVASWAVMHRADGAPVVNWYGPGSTQLEIGSGSTVTLVQETEYPLSGTVLLRVESAAPKAYALSLRIPQWSTQTHVEVNGDALPMPAPGTYLVIERTWSPDDTVRMEFDFSLHFWIGDRECAGTTSVYRGPLLLAYDPRYGVHDPGQLPEIDLMQLKVEQMPTEGWMAPWLLVRATDGESELTLCDFTSAGATGTPYRSWLPARGMSPVEFSRDACIWARR